MTLPSDTSLHVHFIGNCHHGQKAIIPTAGPPFTVEG